MRKIISYFILLGITTFVFSGCNAFKGLSKDTKSGWQTMKRWDQKFKDTAW